MDANIRNDRTKEAIGTISHELFANFGVDVSYIWRRDDRGTWSHRIGETRDMWVQREWPTPTTPPAAITAIPAGLPTSGWQFWEIAPGVTLPFVHRPLSRYVNALHDVGLVLERMDEPAPPPGFIARAPEYESAATIPRLLALRTRRLP